MTRRKWFKAILGLVGAAATPISLAPALEVNLDGFGSVRFRRQVAASALAELQRLSSPWSPALVAEIQACAAASERAFNETFFAIVRGREPGL